MKNIICIIFLLATSNTFFHLGPWWHNPGVFNVVDIGNLIIISITASSPFIFKKDQIKPAINPLTPLVFFYLAMAFIQIPIASLNYNQTFFDGMVGIRHQFYYLSFFLFLFLYKGYHPIKLLDLLGILSILLFLLGLLNYFGPNFIYHKYGEGHGTRAGITRGYIPGMDIISFSLIWVFTKWNSTKKFQLKRTCNIIFLSAAHFFRQSRMRLISVFITIIIGLFIKRRWKHIFSLVFLLSFATIVTNYTMEKNIVLVTISSAFEEFSSDTGTWAPRISQINTSLHEFKKHPVFGSGVSAIRSVSQNFSSLMHIKLQEVSYKHDLGYIHFLKAYGLIGAFWFILFIGAQVYMCYKSKPYCSGEDSLVLNFCLSYIFFLLFSFITLNQMMFPQRIILICLNASFITSIYFKYRKMRDSFENLHTDH